MVVLGEGAVSYEQGTPVVPLPQSNTLSTELESQVQNQELAKVVKTFEVLPFLLVKDSGLVGSTDFLGGVPQEQKMFNGHLPRVIYHQAY